MPARAAALAALLLCAAQPAASRDWRAPCLTPDFGPDAGEQQQARAMEAAYDCLQTRIEELEQENEAMRLRLSAAERMAREAMALARATAAPPTN